MNPILPIRHFVSDAEARQWKDGRMYFYGSYDISRRASYCSWEYRYVPATNRHTCATTKVTAKPIATGNSAATVVHFLLPVSL